MPDNPPTVSGISNKELVSLDGKALLIILNKRNVDCPLVRIGICNRLLILVRALQLLFLVILNRMKGICFFFFYL